MGGAQIMSMESDSQFAIHDLGFMRIIKSLFT